MRANVFFALSMMLVLGAFGGLHSPLAARPKQEKKDEKKDEKTDDKKDGKKLTAAAERTLSKCLKAKMTVSYTDKQLGEVLKEFAKQVDDKTEIVLMWAYGKDFPFNKKVTYSCKDKPLETALDELFTKNGMLGYVIVSKDGDRRDGWILLTATGERGFDKDALPAATAEEEATAAEKLASAKTLIEGGMNEQAKVVLASIVKRYPTAKATAEAKELLKKLEK